MEVASFILNLPWTIVGLLGSLLSVPYKVQLHKKPFAIIIYVKSYWWRTWRTSQKGVRGSTNGCVITIGKTLDEHDLEHELIHVDQARRQPFVFPFLYLLENHKHGYRKNKYEIEAYSKSGSIYVT